MQGVRVNSSTLFVISETFQQAAKPLTFQGKTSQCLTGLSVSPRLDLYVKSFKFPLNLQRIQFMEFFSYILLNLYS